MNYLHELCIVLLIFIIILSFVQAYSKTSEYFEDINSISNDYAKTGLASYVSCPESSASSTIQVMPNLDDLLNTNLIKPEVKKGLESKSSIISRSCSADNEISGSLLASMESNKSQCEFDMDGKKYKLMSKTIELVVDLEKSTNEKLVLSNTPSLLNFILHRPIFITINNSKPYVLSFDKGMFTYMTYKVDDVEKMKDISLSKPVELKIRSVFDAQYPLFPVTHSQDLTTIFKNKKSTDKTLTGKDVNTAGFNFVVYYMELSNKLPGSVLRVHSTHTSACFNDNGYLKETVKSIKLSSNIKNPIFTIKFSFFISKTAQENYKNEYVNLLNVGVNAWANASLAGRGILSAIVCPASVRKIDYGDGIYEKTNNTNFTQLLFCNVERNSNLNAVSSYEGQSNNMFLWLPVDSKIDICYIVGPSFKCACATFYDNKKRKKDVIYKHMYHCSNTINDVLQSIKTIDNICINNLAKRTNYDPHMVNVSNISIEYGAESVYEWFSSIVS